ncbi:MAG: TonB-dependent receptor [Bacteroidota bacterium]
MKTFYLFTVFLLNSFLLFAQTDTIKTTLNEVVVSANKTETPYYSLASSVSVINSSDITKTQAHSVFDLLRYIPGISVIQQGGIGKLSNSFIRGANPNHALVIVDGIEMNDASSPNNAFDFSTLGTYDIEKIEIVRGPQSTLYGSDAMAGVISIFTKQGTENPNLSFVGEGGSNGFYKAHLATSGKYDFINFFVSANRNGTDGISSSNSSYGNTEKDGFINNGITAKVGFDLSQSGNLQLMYKFTKAESDLDQNEKLGDDPNYIYKTEEQIFSSILHFNSFQGKWEKIFKGSLIKRFGRTLDDYDELHPNTFSDSYNRAQRIKFEWQNNLRVIDNNLISIGLETETEQAYTSYYSESMWGPYESVFPEQSIRTSSIYLQDQINVASSLFASLGIRYDDNEKYGSVTTYRIAPAYFISETGTKLKFTYGTGYKAPSLYYIFDPLFGNPDLKPEKSKGWDIGFDQILENGKINFGVTYFNLKFENMFGFDSNFRTINIAEASSKGVEISASADVLIELDISANYTYTETKDEFNQSSDYGKNLIRRPKHQASLTINYNYDRLLNLNAQVRYIGKRDDKDFNAYPVQRITLADYTIVNLNGSYKLSSYLELTARLENLFDKKYEEVLYYGTLGRTFYIGVNINL